MFSRKKQTFGFNKWDVKYSNDWGEGQTYTE